MQRKPIEGPWWLLAGVCAATVAAAAAPVSSDKGGFRYAEPAPFPEVVLDLAPVEAEIASAASMRCGTPLAAATLDLGDTASVVSELIENAARAAIGEPTGRTPDASTQVPLLYEDPIESRDKVELAHPSGDARLLIGGRFYEDGLLVSAKVDKSNRQGTIHTMFLERIDCARIWPERYLGYELWGSRSSSVPVTETTSSHRDGEGVDDSVSRAHWSKPGTLDATRGFSLWDRLPGEDARIVLDPEQAYLAQLRREIGRPAWQQMGFGEPRNGIRSAGGLFRVEAEDLTPGTIAVVHITQVKKGQKGRYRTLGFPLAVAVGPEHELGLVQLPLAR